MKLRGLTSEEIRKITWEYFHSKTWLDYYNSLAPEHLDKIRTEHYRSKSKVDQKDSA